MKYNAAFYEVFAEEKKLLLQYLPEGYDYYFTNKSIQDTNTHEPLAPVISTRTQSVFPSEWTDALHSIFTRSTGYDHLTRHFKDIGKTITAGYLPKYAARAVAEQTFLLMLMLARKIDAQRTAIRNFSRDGLTGIELRGRSLTIIGVGNIGSEIARIAHGWDMDLLGVDLVEREEIAESYNLKYVPLEEGVREGEILVCALPLTDITYRMLNYNLLNKNKKQAFFINIARGEITPPHDLLKTLDEKTLSGIGIDVYDEESTVGSYLRGEISLEDINDLSVLDSVKATLNLLDHPKVISTPHNAFNTEESTHRKVRQTAENIREFLEQGEFLTSVPLDEIL